MKVVVVVVITGETGCGKTTQVPQYILEAEIKTERGAACSIICTQPRRISAMAVSERVAVERGKSGLLVDRNLKGVSHIIVDEIHERGTNEDFLLVVLKDLLPRRPELRLILMSATLNAELFSSYFGGAPMVYIPEFTYPVRTHFLEDVLEVTRYDLTPYNQTDDYGQDKSWKTQKQTLRKRKSQITFIVEDALEVANFKDYSPQTQDSLSCWNPDSIGFNLIENVLCHKCSNETPGAILVFMTGWDDINALKDQLQAHPLLGDPSRVLLLSCHGSMASSKQRLIFHKPEGGVRKIVLSTNIAETSITIDDVVFRRGRAGRVQPGVCFRLYPRCVYDAFADNQLPELLRTPLQSICLQIKSLQLGSISEFLSRALQSPELLSVRRHLSILPVEPRLGKMLIMGAIFNCLDPILTVVAGLSVRDPFLMPTDKKDLAEHAKAQFAAGDYSDHHANDDLHVYNLWSNDGSLIRAVICAGLFPGICSVVNKETSVSLKTMEDGRVLLYSNSVNGRESNIPYPWLVFNEKVKVNSVFLRDSTAISDSMLLLFGGKLSRGDNDRHLKMLGGYLEFFMKPTLAETYTNLKRGLEKIIQIKIQRKKKKQNRFVFGHQILKPSKVTPAAAPLPPVVISRNGYGTGGGGDNAKNQLQTLVTRAGHENPVYKAYLVKNNQFQAMVINGMQFTGQPCNNRKLAEKDAAPQPLLSLTGRLQACPVDIERVSLLLKQKRKHHQST
ncbi:hypothetical protein IFM89_033596 [Coptis chinensis]|uniref:Helicase ATP-binding domain-containing protein n=1 Tax=Coptis chinensis TaxID=261450 RepID=A0A835I8D6_9MAGN|nr:hypothetical protein IFM89_033596 [Coptis chinensis]